MKIGILSDIHSNIVALKACITYMESVSCDEYLLLGDYISDVLGVSARTIKRHIKEMEDIVFVGSGFSGHWEIRE